MLELNVFETKGYKKCNKHLNHQAANVNQYGHYVHYFLKRISAMLLIGLKLCVSSLDKTLALRQGCGTVGAQANPSYVVHLALPLSLLLKKNITSFNGLSQSSDSQPPCWIHTAHSWVGMNSHSLKSLLRCNGTAHILGVSCVS